MNVAVVLPIVITGAVAEKAMQLANPSSDTWIDPEHGPATTCPTSVAGLIATVNVTPTVVVATAMAPSAGVVLSTSGPATQLPAPSQAVPLFWVHIVPTGAGTGAHIPDTHWDGAHWLPDTGHCELIVHAMPPVLLDAAVLELVDELVDELVLELVDELVDELVLELVDALVLELVDAAVLELVDAAVLELVAIIPPPAPELLDVDVIPPPAPELLAVDAMPPMPELVEATPPAPPAPELLEATPPVPPAPVLLDAPPDPPVLLDAPPAPVLDAVAPPAPVLDAVNVPPPVPPVLLPVGPLVELAVSNLPPVPVLVVVPPPLEHAAAATSRAATKGTPRCFMRAPTVAAMGERVNRVLECCRRSTRGDRREGSRPGSRMPRTGRTVTAA